ncbi:MAG: ABC transporter substrate-binding protein, partial [Desulfobacterales bacterium]|nr:ABC transporter substrate-binding protein [Desulfobacterales bacterium]
MISSIHRVFILLITIGLFLMLPFSTVADDDTSPITKSGKKWRLGYYEGGPYTNYPLNLRALIKGFAKLGWMEKTTIPTLENIALELMPNRKLKKLDTNNSTLIWKWLSKNIKSEYVQFVDSACWSSNWNGDQRKKNRKEAIELLKKGDIDLIIAMGTWAGQDLANNEHSVPTVVMSTSDPVRAGIIKSPEDSGYAHVHAMCDPSRYLRQLRLFHSIINFEKLGVVYENTIEGRTYASLQDIEQVARERDFKIMYCEAPFSGVDEKKATEAIIKCHTELAKKVDAVY